MALSDNTDASDVEQRIRQAIKAADIPTLKTLRSEAIFYEVVDAVRNELMAASAALDDEQTGVMHKQSALSEVVIANRLRFINSIPGQRSEEPPSARSQRHTGTHRIGEKRDSMAQNIGRTGLSNIKPEFIKKLEVKTGRSVQDFYDHPEVLDGQYVGETLVDNRHRVLALHQLFCTNSSKPCVVTICIKRHNTMPKDAYRLEKYARNDGKDSSHFFSIDLAINGLEISSDRIATYHWINGAETELPETHVFQRLSPQVIGEVALKKNPEFPDPKKFKNKWTGLFLARMHPCNELAEAIQEIPYEAILRDFSGSPEFAKILTNVGYDLAPEGFYYVTAAMAPEITSGGLRGSGK